MHCRRFRRLPAVLARFATTALADTVHLKNVDRITGTVLRKSGDALRVKAEYAGELKIRWQDVAEIRTDAPASVLLDDDTRTEAMQLGGDQSPLLLDRIAYVNPTPGEAGTGTDYSGQVTLAATVTGGNTDTERYCGEARFRGRGKSRRFSIGANATEASDEGESTASNWRVYGDHDWFFQPREFL